jgi:hypothetical protein
MKDDGCVNCGLLGVALNQEGYCQGCTCLNCGAGGSMNEASWCGGCENILAAYDPRATSCFDVPSGERR